MSQSENSFIEIFLEEADEAASAWEKACLSLESDTSDETINKLFRTAHNLKGSSKSIGLSDFGDFIHEVENLITKIKNKTLSVEPGVISILLEAESYIRKWIETLRQDSTGVCDCSEFLSRIKDFGSVPKQDLNTSMSSQQTLTKDLVQTLSNAKAGDIVFSSDFDQKIIASQPRAAVAKNETTNSQANQNSQNESIRINLQRLDTLINLVGELVIEHNILSKKIENLGDAHAELHANSSRITKTVSEIQNVAMSFRMIPVAQQFQKMQRTVRDLAQSQGKQIQFQTTGEDVELDKTVVDSLGDPLTHLIRNAVDHGIETPDIRKQRNKEPAAKVDLMASQRDDHVEIIVKDDGNGIDPERVFAKAVEKGLIPSHAKMSDKEIFNLIFLPGFSTKEQVTDVSGRGVGMDVVNRLVTEIKGSIDISSVKGAGTTFTIRLPLSLSVIRGLVARIGSETFVLPTSQLVEVFDFDKMKIESHTGKARMMNMRGEVLPVFRLEELIWRKKISTSSKNASGVVVNCKTRKVALQFDEILDEQSVVLKKLSTKLQDLPGILGGAVLSNGEPALVLSLPDIVERWGSHAA